MHLCLNCEGLLSCDRAYIKYGNTNGCSNKNCKTRYCKKCRFIGSRSPLWKNARTISSLGYVQISRNAKLVYEHRYLMEKHLGRKLLPNECVHHINGIKKDNRLKNLIIMSSSNHQSMHCSGKKMSKENREKMRQSKLGSKNPMYGKTPWNKKTIPL